MEKFTSLGVAEEEPIGGIPPEDGRNRRITFKIVEVTEAAPATGENKEPAKTEDNKAAGENSDNTGSDAQPAEESQPAENAQ